MENQGECRTGDALEWVAWFHHHRLLEPIGNIPPVEADANYYRKLAESEMIV